MEWVQSALAAAKHAQRNQQQLYDAADAASAEAAVKRDDEKTRLEQLESVISNLEDLLKPASEGRYPL